MPINGKPGSWVDDNKKAKIINDCSIRKVKFIDGRLGYAALTMQGLARLDFMSKYGELDGFKLYYWDRHIHMAIQEKK